MVWLTEFARVGVIMEDNVSLKAKFFKVPSRTRDKYHTVRLMPNGEWRCDCEHFTFTNKLCYHIEYAKVNYSRGERSKNK